MASEMVPRGCLGFTVDFKSDWNAGEDCANKGDVGDPSAHVGKATFGSVWVKNLLQG